MTTALRRTSTNPYLEGNYAPVHRETTAVDLEITGTVPGYLDGRYLRNGPNPLDDPDPDRYHLFLGAGMVHGLRLRDGRAQWYRNRWVRSADVARHLGEHWRRAARRRIRFRGQHQRHRARRPDVGARGSGCAAVRTHRRAGNRWAVRLLRNVVRGLHRTSQTRSRHR